MNFNDALEAALLESDVPAITDYEFFMLGARIYAEPSWNGHKLTRLPSGWDHERMRNAQRRLRYRGAIAPDADFSLGMWRVVQSTRAGSPEEMASIADPFCYVSHLSAMVRYGLTDRSPEALHLTTPKRSVWNRMRDKKILGDTANQPLVQTPTLIRFGFKDVIRRRPVVVHETTHPATPVSIRGERTRITDVGTTFADMLDQPKLCGGMRHVQDVWDRHAADWADKIVEAIESHDSKIVKVRAGYLLTERLGIENPKIAAWQRFAQRGGSRKLDPDSDYKPQYSERWMISLNV